MFNKIARTTLALGASTFIPYKLNNENLRISSIFSNAKIPSQQNATSSNSTYTKDQQSPPWFFHLFPKAFCDPVNYFKTEDYSSRFVTPRKTLKDFGGSLEILEQTYDVIRYFQKPEYFTNLGIKPPKGMIIAGAPGIGKSLLAECIAGHAAIRFLMISASELRASLVGETEHNLRNLFNEAEKNAPCIVCIDEIDSIGPSRTGQDMRLHEKSAVNQLLTLLDKEHPGVYIIGTTNHLNSLDSALVRPGRFDKSIVIPPPDKEGRLQILQLNTKNKKLAADINLKELADSCDGFSGARIATWVNEAAMQALRLDRITITLQDFTSTRLTLRGVIIGAASTDPEEKKRTAIHEIGHAFIGHFLGLKLDITSVRKTGHKFGFTLFSENDHLNPSKNQLLDKICMLLGGRAAEILFKDMRTGSRDNMKHVKDLISLIEEEGMMSDLETPETILKEQSQRALDILRKNQTKVEFAIAQLVKHETFNRDEFAKVLSKQPLPPASASSSLTAKSTAMPAPTQRWL